MSSKSPDALYSLLSISILGACVGLAGCGALDGGAEVAERTGVSAFALNEPAVGACHKSATATVTTADTCAGTGAGRIVVKLRAGATCGALFGVPMGALTANGLRKKYLFDTAPASLRETYCVLEDGIAPLAGTTDARAEAIVSDLCASVDVETTSRDCSAELARSSTVANAYAPPDAALVSKPPAPTTTRTSNGASSATPASSASADPPPSEADMGKNSCDVCVTAAGGSLYVSVPSSFATAAPSTLAVRVSTPGAPDLYVAPPLRSQSFVVEKVTVASGAKVTIYAPGVSPPGRGQRQ